MQRLFLDISGYAWAMLDDFLSAMEALASECPIDIYLIFDAHQNPRKMETSEERKALTEKVAEDLESYISSRDAYNEKKMIDLMSGCVKLFIQTISSLLLVMIMR